MTLENYNYRTDPLFLRNQFDEKGDGKYKIPQIPKAEFTDSERIICYNTPFPEMQGNIVFVDYELSSWKYQNKEYIPSEYVKYITGELPLPSDCDIIIKRGYIPSQCDEKGMGSAYGGEWQPKKEEDKRFLGKPGEIKESYSRSGVRQLTKIGKNGKAKIERHFSDHGTPKSHTNPHDHKIDWSRGFPDPGKPINYPSGAPEFKFYKENKYMNKRIEAFEELKFESLGDFKWHIVRGCEIEFIWDNKYYSITHPDGKICISEGYYLKDGKAYNLLSHTEYDTETSFTSNDINDIIEFSLGKNKLREVATEIGIVYRSI